MERPIRDHDAHRLLDIGALPPGAAHDIPSPGDALPPTTRPASVLQRTDDHAAASGPLKVWNSRFATTAIRAEEDGGGITLARAANSSAITSWGDSAMMPPPPRRMKEPPAYPISQGGMIKQPDTRPISQEQLVAEVKGIYAGLVMVESKCIEVDNQQSNKTEPVLNDEQWQALIALHRTLLHEHHDFFLASQHPSASPSLRRLASKYAMPARMWRPSIHSFLELLRHKRPESRDDALSFTYLAYSMMALLYETVPGSADTWVECLGDLGRYR